MVRMTRSIIRTKRRENAISFSLTPLSMGKTSEKSPFGRRTLEIFGERQALTRLMIFGPKTIFLNNEKKELVTDTIKSLFKVRVCDKCFSFFAFSITLGECEDVVDLS